MSFRAVVARQTKVAMRAPATMIRTYVPDVRPEGTTGSSKGFSQREQAEEGQYIRKKELEKLKQAQDKVTAAQKELDEQQKKVDQSK